MSEITTDVVVVGAGNAALTAAISAASRGRNVLVLEKAPENQRGGNSFFTAGATRIAHDGLEDLADLVDVDDRHAVTVVPPYSADEYRSDIERVTEGRNDPAMTDVLVAEAAETLRWLKGLGANYRLMYERQAYALADGTYRFWGGLHVGNTGGGVGLIDDLLAIASRLGVVVRYEHSVDELIIEDGVVVGVRGTAPGAAFEVRSDSVIIAAGGFESNAEKRREYLGEGWQNAKVRGTPFNQGELLDAGLAAGAARGGDWSTCHSTQWDAFNPENESNFELTNRLTRQSYPLGILVNTQGERFVDEGEDFRNYTYAKFGRDVLAQPGSTAWQIFDAELRPQLREEEYDMPGISMVTAATPEELAAKMNVPVDRFVTTLREFNASIDTSIPLDPTVKDGRAAEVTPRKSNWATPLETGPYYAYAVTCGITFTFGGLKGDVDGRVLREDGTTIPGLFACGEALGGLFSANYPGGSGLAAGAVFGRRAGALA